MRIMSPLKKKRHDTDALLVRMIPEERELLEKLSAKLGRAPWSQVIRLAIRRLAEIEKVA